MPKKRKMQIIGLTGSIGMGKSTAAEILRAYGFPVYDADKAVHDALKKGGAGVARVGRLFPHAKKRGGIDRAILGREIFGEPEKLRALERILHPLARRAERAFLQKAKKAGAPAAILEIPLLFETGGDTRCDTTFCVIAPRAAQKARVLGRPGMTARKFRAIRALQMPDAQKRKRADFVIPTGKSLAATAAAIDKALRKLGLAEPA